MLDSMCEMSRMLHPEIGGKVEQQGGRGDLLFLQENVFTATPWPRH